MRRLLVFALAGLFGQLVDGALGMAFGVTSSTVLLSNGIAPAASSASVHLAEIGTTFTSGVSHWRFGNVSWPLVVRIGVPGAVGAFAGATVLSSLTADWLAGAVALVLFGLGLLVVVRAARGDLRGHKRQPGHLRRRFLAPLGLGAGFLDAVGGGGWGPVATPTLLTVGKVEPRLVIGSVSASELMVTLAASAGFLTRLGGEGIQASLVLALLAGGVVAAPLAAWLVHRVDASTLGVVVGTLLLVTNARTLLQEAGVAGPLRLPVLLALIVAGAVVARRVAAVSAAERRDAREREPVAPDVVAEAPEPVAVEPGGVDALAPVVPEVVAAAEPGGAEVVAAAAAVERGVADGLPDAAPVASPWPGGTAAPPADGV